jgi:hypothetical protein
MLGFKRWLVNSRLIPQHFLLGSDVVVPHAFVGVCSIDGNVYTNGCRPGASVAAGLLLFTVNSAVTAAVSGAQSRWRASGASHGTS